MQTDNIIVIDGPSGTGKGTVCHKLAAYLNWNVLDSGSIYRVLAYAARLYNVSLDDVASLVDLSHKLLLSFKTTADYNVLIYLNDEEIHQKIRTEQCGQDASYIAALADVRLALLDLQRSFAKAPGLVADGRDLGTVVFPDAKIKIYLDASQEQRAYRRYFQLKKQGNHVSLADVADELSKRDTRDLTRANAPLKMDASAIYIDNTDLSVEQTFEKVCEICMSHGVVVGDVTINS